MPNYKELKYDRRFIVEHIIKNFDRSSSIIDFGCNKSLMLDYLYDYGFKNLIGYDMDVFPSKRFTTRQFNINNHNYAEDKKDIIICSMVLEHVYNPYHLFEVLSQALKPDGTIYMCFPNMDNIFHRLTFLFTGENMRFLKQFSNKTFITKETLKRYLYGEVYQWDDDLKPIFSIIEDFILCAELPLLHIKLPKIKAFAMHNTIILRRA